MNLIQEHPDKNKLAIALLYLPSLIEVNLIRLATMSANDQMTFISTITKPPKANPTYKNVF